ncbi:mannose binding, partial [Branchiostoma belcheri]
MRLKVAQVYGLIGGGYSAWITALRIKGRQADIPAVVQEGKTKLNDVKQSLQPYVDYGKCSGDYQRKNRKCYKAISIWQNWADASAYCQSQGAGGNLAMAKDSSTNNFLIQLKNAESSSWGFWFGLNDRGSEGQWKWPDGTSLESFNYWSPVEPNNGGKNWLGQYNNPEDCVEYFRRDWRDSNWNDVDCSETRYFICERTPNVKMYEQAQPVRFPVSGSGNNQTSGPQAQAPSVHQSGLHRRVSHGNGATNKRQEGIEMPSDTYEEPEAVNLSPPFREARLQRAKLRGEPPIEAADTRNTRRYVDLPDATDHKYPGGADGRRRVVRDCVPSYRGCLAGATAVVVTMVIVTLAEIFRMSSTVDTLKRNIEGIFQLSDIVDTLKRSMENLTDKFNIPSSCTEVGERSGFDNSRFYTIDPDGPGRGVLPMTVQCDLEGQTAITIIGHNSETRTYVHEFENPGSYSKDVVYWNSIEQVRALVDRSSRCKQHIK